MTKDIFQNISEENYTNEEYRFNTSSVSFVLKTAPIKKAPLRRFFLLAGCWLPMH
jgi:hypothetical protein